MKVSEIGIDSTITTKKTFKGSIKNVSLDLQFHILLHKATNKVVGFYHVGRHIAVSIDKYKLPKKEIEGFMIELSYPDDDSKITWINIAFSEFEKHLAIPNDWSDHSLINITLYPEKYKLS